MAMEGPFLKIRTRMAIEIGAGDIKIGTIAIDSELKSITSKLIVIVSAYFSLWLVVAVWVSVKVLTISAKMSPSPKLAYHWFVVAWPYFDWIMVPLAILLLSIFPLGVYVPAFRQWVGRAITLNAPRVSASIAEFASGEWELRSGAAPVPISLFRSPYAALLACDEDGRFWRALPRASDGRAFRIAIECRRIEVPAKVEAEVVPPTLEIVPVKEVVAADAHFIAVVPLAMKAEWIEYVVAHMDWTGKNEQRGKIMLSTAFDEFHAAAPTCTKLSNAAVVKKCAITIQTAGLKAGLTQGSDRQESDSTEWIKDCLGQGRKQPYCRVRELTQAFTHQLTR